MKKLSIKHRDGEEGEEGEEGGGEGNRERGLLTFLF